MFVQEVLSRLEGNEPTGLSASIRLEVPFKDCGKPKTEQTELGFRRRGRTLGECKWQAGLAGRCIRNWTRITRRATRVFLSHLTYHTCGEDDLLDTKKLTNGLLLKLIFSSSLTTSIGKL